MFAVGSGHGLALYFTLAQGTLAAVSECFVMPMPNGYHFEDKREEKLVVPSRLSSNARWKFVNSCIYFFLT